MAPPLRKTVVSPLGIVTTPNEFGQYPEGALSDARNFVMRSPGVLSVAPTWTGNLGLGATNEVVRKIYPLDAGANYEFIENAAGTSYTLLERANSTAYPQGVSGTGLFTPGRITPVRARERMLANSTEGVMVADFMSPTNLTQRTLRMAGMPQPAIDLFIQTSGASGPIPPTIMVGYAAVFVREFSDGYVIRSVPSPITKSFYDATNYRSYGVQVIWPFNAGLVTGDFLEIYRTDGIVATSDLDDPGTTLKLVARVTMTATLGIGGVVTIVDNQYLVTPYYQTPGRELYTNPGQEGSTAANRQPDVNGAQAVFRGFTFFGNLTERAQWSFSVPAGFGNQDVGVPYLNTAYLRANGLGLRLSVTGTVTNGSPTITGIAAGDIVGVVVGQLATSGALFPANTLVTAVGASTLTLSNNATGGGTGFTTYDRLEIDGVATDFGSPSRFVRVLAGYTTSAGREVTLNQSVGVSTTPGLTFTVETLRPNFGPTITVRGTNGQNYSPPIPQIAATVQTFSPKTTKNLMRWSKSNEPEHVPAKNESRVGAGTLIQYVSTKDALWIFCTDGVFRLSGADGNWNIDVIDPRCVLCAPQCAAELLGQVYAYTNQGFVLVTDAGIAQVSAGVVKELLPGQPFSELGDMIVERNETDREILISLSRTANQILIYNTQQNAWTTILNGGVGFDGIASIAFASYPSATISVPGCIMLGRSPVGSTPGYVYWNGTAAISANAFARWQPLYAKDPMLLKQWVDITYLCDANAAGQALSTSFGNATVSNGSVLLAAPTAGAAAGAIGTVGMHRNYAISTALQPEFAIVGGGNPPVSLRGMSARYVPLTEQQGTR